jgi:hypothetical protein
VAETAIGTSIDGENLLNSEYVEVGTQFYLQIQVAVESNSFMRRLLRNNNIPFTIEISNPGIAEFSIQKARNIEETKSPEMDESKTIYFFNVLAAKEPDTAIINLKGIAKKVHGKYSKIETIQYESTPVS